MRETGARRRGSCITSRGGRSIVCNRFGYRCGNCNWTVLFQFANAYCIGGARSRSGVALIGFAVMLVSVVDEMHERAGQKQQVWQRGQGVTRMRPEQIASECREQEGNRKPEFRMKKAENGVHHGFSCNRSATVLLFWPFAGACRQRTDALGASVRKTKTPTIQSLSSPEKSTRAQLECGTTVWGPPL